MDVLDREVFDDDCRRFFAINPSINEGVNGGEDSIHLDEHGNVLRGGRPSNAEKDSSKLGKNWRNIIRDEIARQKLIRPPQNYYREKNRVFDDY